MLIWAWAMLISSVIMHIIHEELALYKMLLVANLANAIMMRKNRKMAETLAHGYTSDSTQQELSNEYQHDRL